ncbi:type II toxin-antitoxin system HicA family toxin [Candidatus Woesearchaeota archaeon]|nr:type II toxin-antitoxin system HicA family toxin [Candidatus Woesearchaeota archaeon]
MKLPVLSGREVVKLLCNKFGFKVLDQTGSHVILFGERDGVKRKPVVPQHPELAKGTLLSILKQAGLTRDDLENALK